MKLGSELNIDKNILYFQEVLFIPFFLKCNLPILLVFFFWSHMCPVKTYDLYTSRLDPRQNRLWQTPKQGVNWNDELRYSPLPIGKTKCQDLMPNLYLNAGLSKRYTNHCIRSTVVGILDRGKFGARKIMRWTGHKSKSSVKSYAHTTTNAEKKEMAEYLTKAAEGKENIPMNGQNQPLAVKAQETTSPEAAVASDLSFRELLELTPEQEKDLLKDLFSTDMEIPPSVPNNSVVQNVSNVAQPVTSIMPKMMFQNSTVTINFNVTK